MKYWKLEKNEPSGTLLFVGLFCLAAAPLALLLAKVAGLTSLARLLLDCGQQCGNEAAGNAASGAFGGGAVCPNSPLYNLPPADRDRERQNCDDWRRTIQSGLDRDGMNSPTIQRSWDGWEESCYNKGYQHTGTSDDSFARPAKSPQEVLDLCNQRFK